MYLLAARWDTGLVNTFTKRIIERIVSRGMTIAKPDGFLSLPHLTAALAAMESI